MSALFRFFRKIAGQKHKRLHDKYIDRDINDTADGVVAEVPCHSRKMGNRDTPHTQASKGVEYIISLFDFTHKKSSLKLLLFCPSYGALQCFLPAGQKRLPLFICHGWRKCPVNLPVFQHVVLVFQYPVASPAR